MIFTRAMLVCSKDFKSFLSRFWSWILINLWYDLKASTLVRAPNPWARCVVGLFLAFFVIHGIDTVHWTVGNLYLSMSSISNHPNTTKIHCKCPCQRSGLSDRESQAKNQKEYLPWKRQKWNEKREGYRIIQLHQEYAKWNVFFESRGGAVR